MDSFAVVPAARPRTVEIVESFPSTTGNFAGNFAESHIASVLKCATQIPNHALESSVTYGGATHLVKMTPTFASTAPKVIETVVSAAFPASTNPFDEIRHKGEAETAACSDAAAKADAKCVELRAMQSSYDRERSNAYRQVETSLNALKSAQLTNQQFPNDLNAARLLVAQDNHNLAEKNMADVNDRFAAYEQQIKQADVDVLKKQGEYAMAVAKCDLNPFATEFVPGNVISAAYPSSMHGSAPAVVPAPIVAPAVIPAPIVAPAVIPVPIVAPVPILAMIKQQFANASTNTQATIVAFVVLMIAVLLSMLR